MADKFIFLIILIYLHASHCRSGEDEVTKNTIPQTKHHSRDETEDMHTDQVEFTEHVRHHHRHHNDPVEMPSSRLKLFEQTDMDGDGFVTRREYALHNGLSDNTTDVEDLFLTYDRDNDGQLSEQEFVDQSSPWEVINECEFQVMQKCNAELDQSMNEADSELDEPSLCRGLQSYLDCVMGGKRTSENCDIESYISSVKQTALVYRSAGLCPNLEIGKFDFDIEIDYEPKDEIIAEYDEYDALIASEFSSDSTSSLGRPARSLSDADDEATSEQLQNEIDNLTDRKCSSNLLLPCDTEFETGISNDIETKFNLQRYRECVLQNTRHCGNDRQNLLFREGLKIIAKKHRAIFQSEFTKDASHRTPK